MANQVFRVIDAGTVRRSSPSAQWGDEQHLKAPPHGQALVAGSVSPSLPDESLLRTIEGEIIPRLMLALARPEKQVAHRNGATSETGDAPELARLLLEQDRSDASAFLRGVQERGMHADQICGELLPQTARSIREKWEHSDCELTQMVSALERLVGLLGALVRR